MGTAVARVMFLVLAVDTADATTLVLVLGEPDFRNRPWYARAASGEKIFSSKCKSCHQLGETPKLQLPRLRQLGSSGGKAG